MVSKRVSLAIIGTVLSSIGIAAVAFAYAIATGMVEVNAQVNFVGTIPVDILAYAVMGFIGWMVYIAFMDIYGDDTVDEADQRIEDLRERL